MKKFFALLATSLLTLSSVSAEDYTEWGYYMGDLRN